MKKLSLIVGVLLLGLVARGDEGKECYQSVNFPTGSQLTRIKVLKDMPQHDWIRTKIPDGHCTSAGMALHAGRVYEHGLDTATLEYMGQGLAKSSVMVYVDGSWFSIFCVVQGRDPRPQDFQTAYRDYLELSFLPFDSNSGKRLCE